MHTVFRDILLTPSTKKRKHSAHVFHKSVLVLVLTLLFLAVPPVLQPPLALPAVAQQAASDVLDEAAAARE